MEWKANSHISTLHLPTTAQILTLSLELSCSTAVSVHQKIPLLTDWSWRHTAGPMLQLQWAHWAGDKDVCPLWCWLLSALESLQEFLWLPAGLETELAICKRPNQIKRTFRQACKHINLIFLHASSSPEASSSLWLQDRSSRQRSTSRTWPRSVTTAAIPKNQRKLWCRCCVEVLAPP